MKISKKIQSDDGRIYHLLSRQNDRWIYVDRFLVKNIKDGVETHAGTPFCED